MRLKYNGINIVQINSKKYEVSRGTTILYITDSLENAIEYAELVA
jgi:hypothetical protein